MAKLEPPVDLGVITIREDECDAVVRRLGEIDLEGIPPTSNWSYTTARVPNVYGGHFRIAVARTHGQGGGFAQATTEAMRSDIEPKWIVVVGICGAVPDDEFTLGDVVIATRLHDFSVSALLPGSAKEFTNLGGEMAPDIQNLTANLPTLKRTLDGWQEDSFLKTPPPVDWKAEKNYTGTLKWNEKVRKCLEESFGPQSNRTGPRVTARSVASSGDLIKDSGVVEQWLNGARDLAGIEMELPGIYRAAAATRSRSQIPVLAVRGISDIIGFNRDPRWTKYACHSAAAFFIALLGKVHPSLLPTSGQSRLPTTSTKVLSKTVGINERPPVLISASTPLTKKRRNLNRDGSAVAFAERFGASDRRVIGSVIETHGNPFLESETSVQNMGWPPERVLLRVRKGQFDAREMLADRAVVESFEKREKDRKERGEGTSLKLPDGTKYVAVDASSPFLEVDEFTVTLQETNYFSILRTRPAIEESFDVKVRYGHIDPEKNRVPQALGVQFIAMFGGTELLAIRRAKDTFPWPGTWSFSGEEQCAPVDVSWDEPIRMKNFLLRTAVEEIFPLARTLEPEKLLEVMQMAESHINSMRTWSLFLEEPTVTFSFFSVFTFDLGIKEYADRVKEMVHQGLGQSSHEGRYFSVRAQDAPQLLQGQTVPARPVFGGNATELSPSLLHPTSLYRLGRFLESIGL
jgi:nucleoside phosphorylase